MERAYAKQSKVEGRNIRLTNASHMPNLNNSMLVLLCEFILRGGAAPVWTKAEYTQKTLQPTLPTSLLTLTVMSHAGRAGVMLRRSATSKPDWYADRRHIKNGESVAAEKEGLDEKGHKMLFVETKDASGWIYAINIKEMI